MVKKLITYTDYNGTTRTDPFYFNISAPELFDIQVNADHSDLETMLKTVIADRDGKKIMEIFSTLIKTAYGIKSDDGKTFVKDEKYTKEFCQSKAYDELFLELVTDAQKAADFVNALIPPDIVEKLKKMKEQDATQIPAAVPGV